MVKRGIKPVRRISIPLGKQTVGEVHVGNSNGGRRWGVENVEQSPPPFPPLRNQANHLPTQSINHLLRNRQRLASESNRRPILEAHRMRPNFPSASLSTQLIAAAAPSRRDLIPSAKRSACRHPVMMEAIMAARSRVRQPHSTRVLVRAAACITIILIPYFCYPQRNTAQHRAAQRPLHRNQAVNISQNPAALLRARAQQPFHRIETHTAASYIIVYRQTG